MRQETRNTEADRNGRKHKVDFGQPFREKERQTDGHSPTDERKQRQVKALTGLIANGQRKMEGTEGRMFASEIRKTNMILIKIYKK